MKAIRFLIWAATESTLHCRRQMLSEPSTADAADVGTEPSSSLPIPDPSLPGDDEPCPPPKGGRVPESGENSDRQNREGPGAGASVAGEGEEPPENQAVPKRATDGVEAVEGVDYECEEGEGRVYQLMKV
jgi:hypothetical protein